MASERGLRTAVWYGDSPLALDFPPDWEVTYLWPNTPPPLSEEQIRERLERPIGQPTIRELCRGKSRPVVIVDDMNRPTPAARVLPSLLLQFREAGIAAERVTIVMARGSHGAPKMSDFAERKIGPEAAAACRFILHDPYRGNTNIGRTAFGTPIIVNRHVLAGDFLVGIGGIYPNHTAGFGGGSKLALGVLDIKSISYLHHLHNPVGWGSPALDGNFRTDLNEIAARIGLQTAVCIQINAAREVIRVSSGDRLLSYQEEVPYAREFFRVPAPKGADVVLSNAYPNDLSLTFVQMKGIVPLEHCPAEASRIVLAACNEGAGGHGVYPVVYPPRYHEAWDYLRRLSVTPWSEIMGKGRRFVRRLLKSSSPGNSPAGGGASEASPGPTRPRHPIWLHQTSRQTEQFPPQVRQMRTGRSWPEIVAAVRQEQANRSPLKVLVYPCAPLQILDRSLEVSWEKAAMETVEAG